MEIVHGNPEKAEYSGDTTRKKARALALALAQEKDRLPNGRLSPEKYIEIVDHVRATDPSYESREDRNISIVEGGLVRNAVIGYLRRIINVLEDTESKYTPAERVFMDDLFTEIQEITPGVNEPKDLFRVFSINPPKTIAPTAYNQRAPEYTPPPQSGPGMDNSNLVWDDFWANYHNSQPQFIGNPTSGYVQPVSQKPLVNAGTSIGKQVR